MSTNSDRHSVSNNNSRLGAKLGLAAAVAALAPAFSTAAAQDDSEQEARQETVIVTATKREQSIQDIPASVSQISGTDLSARGISDIENLATSIPNLTYGEFGSNTFISIRGIGTTVDSGVAEPSVATYVDGIFLPRSTMAVTKQTDLERVEVLRGPQGTLYGRNATGGAINFVSRAPSDVLEGGGSLTIEERNGVGVDGYISGPLGDQAAFRLSGGVEEQDGYVDVLNTGDDLLNRDAWFARGALQFRPSDDLTFDISVHHEEDDGVNTAQTFITEPVNVTGLGALLMIPVGFSTEPNTIIADGGASGESETTIISARVNWDLSDSVSFRSTTGYVDHSINSQFDADGTDFFFVNADAFPRESSSFSQEFNLYGSAERLDWLIGAYYFEEEFELQLPVSFNGLLFMSPAPSISAVAGDIVEDTTSYALFGDVSFALTDRLKLNGGLRFNNEEKEFEFFGAPSPAGNLDSDDILPKIGLQFDVNQDVNIYGQWQQGIKSGGHQLDRPETFAAEQLDAFEVGVKSEFMDGALTANAAIFFYDYQDLQATITIPPATTLIESGDAEVSGFEGEVYYAPSSSVRLNFGVSMLDAEYTELTSTDQALPGGPTVDLAGEDLIRAPEFTVNFGGEWRIPVNSSFIGDILLRGDAFHSSDYKLAFIDYAETRQEAYTTVDLSATITDPSDRFALRVFVDNATDEVYLNNGSFLATTGAFIGVFSEPRTAGVSLSAKF